MLVFLATGENVIILPHFIHSLRSSLCCQLTAWKDVIPFFVWLPPLSWQPTSHNKQERMVRGALDGTRVVGKLLALSVDS